MRTSPSNKSIKNMKKYKYKNRITREIKDSDKLINGNEWILINVFHAKPITKYYKK